MTDIKRFLREYDGPAVRIMEVCGTHTAEISRNGIPGMLSEKISLISGPGCPVCVTVTEYIDRLIALSKEPGHVVVSFGDMLRVPGKNGSLNDARAQGGNVRMVYSPMDMLALAAKNPGLKYIFAAVGFETTAPVYASLLDEAINNGIGNISLLSALKTMPPVIDRVCANGAGIDGFIAPGHVSVVTGSDIFIPLAQKYKIPFAVAGFTGEALLAAIYALVRRRGQACVMNLYPSAVTAQGNRKAQALVSKYFGPCGAAWRGIGAIPSSGMILRQEYRRFDAGSFGLDSDESKNPQCRCAQVLTGECAPPQCPLFGTACTPQDPQGACMVSTEGSCYHYLINNRKQERL